MFTTGFRRQGWPTLDYSHVRDQKFGVFAPAPLRPQGLETVCVTWEWYLLVDSGGVEEGVGYEPLICICLMTLLRCAGVPPTRTFNLLVKYRLPERRPKKFPKKRKK